MLRYALLTFGSLFAIIDPFAVIPAFLAMTARDTAEQKRRMAKTACLVCWLVMTLFAVMGPSIFGFLGITLPAFQIAGGLVLLLSSLDMLRAKRSALKETQEEMEEGMSKEDIAITPLAVPMLSGPGAITTAIVLSQQAEDWPRRAIFYAAIAVASLLTYLILTAASSGARKLSPTVLNIITRLMGLLLAAVGVQFILNAVHALKLG
ncbi:MAG: NAAT family transporter [Elusimicrobia bacterium]|nr:NAAT family transporter [Elusimicrobiota bacterium]